MIYKELINLNKHQGIKGKEIMMIKIKIVSKSNNASFLFFDFHNAYHSVPFKFKLEKNF